ncbi:MAG: aspartate aminotransferase family protein [Azospirillaceae bacterium]
MTMAAIDQANMTLDDALAAAEARYVEANPASAAAFREAQAVMPGGNTRSVLHFSPFPLGIREGEGAWLTDADGHRLLDFVGEFSAGLYGHSEPRIRRAIDEALDHGTVLGGPNRYEAAFARAICDRFPAIERVRFCNSGTEANLYALSAARAFTGRDDVMVLSGAYHGGTFTFSGPNPLNVPFPWHEIALNDIEGAREAIRRLGDRLAAVIVEPMMGAGGCFPASPGFLTALREETERTGVMLVFDEVMTSRMAPGSVHGLFGIRPDLVTLGKYVGGGMTFGAFGGRADLMARFDPSTPDYWGHAGTFNNSVVTMAAGLAGLTEVLTPAALEALNARGERLRDGMRRAIDDLDLPMQVNGMGSMTAFHFATRAAERPEDLPAVSPGLRALIHLELIARGLYTARRGLVALSLPVTDADIDRFLAGFHAVLEENTTIIRRHLDVPA